MGKAVNTKKKKNAKKEDVDLSEILTPRMIAALVLLVATVALAAALTLFYLPGAVGRSREIAMRLRDIEFEKTERSVYLDDEIYIEAVCEPAVHSSEVSWSVEDDKIAQVVTSSDIGITLIGKAEGETRVVAESDSGLKASCTLTVVRKPLPPDSDLPSNYYEELLIANQDNPLSADYVPELVKIDSKYPTAYPKTTMVTPECKKAYEWMYDTMQREIGGKMRIISSYRSYKKQTQLFNNAVHKYKTTSNTRAQAEALALRTTQKPGWSEHQLGLSIDVSNGYDTEHQFHTTKVGEWVTENCHRFGFVIRYPADKVSITKINYEPWHLRYVGIEHAAYMYEHSLCLEEYVELQNQAAQEAAQYALENPLE